MHKILIVDDEKPARDFIAELVAFYIHDAKIISVDHPQKAQVAIHCNEQEVRFEASREKNATLFLKSI
jgi:DNA-binding LytR/AlgR family response regulator